jgi:protein SCO1/2
VSRLGSFAALAACAALVAIAPPGRADPVPGDEPRSPSGLTKRDLGDIGFDQRLGEALPLDAPFKDETGKDVKLGDEFGERPVVLALVYNECPMLCSLVLQGLVGSMRAIPEQPGKDFDVVALSFDPRDTVESARKKKELYVRRYDRPGTAAGFHFLTGDRASIDRVTKAVGFHYAFDPKTGQYAHPAGVLVLTKTGTVARYLFGAEFSPKDLDFSLTEASQGKVGSLATKLLLLCYHYDPIQGTYSASAMTAVRAGGALTLVALLGFMGISLRRERKRRRLGARQGEGT